jgi:phosphoribosylaminoimidazolecarboxamide formyltransferase/IMP cyclohydrolase
VPRALISVSDKRGVVPFARGLHGLGWDIVSTGGTAAALGKAGIPVVPVSDVTGFPEILDGRVKTLHPRIHAGLLARRDIPTHVGALAEHGIVPFDLVAVNLYPFRATVASPNVTEEDALENIDVGGPAMLRAAAKNHQHVVAIVDPKDYDGVLDMLRQGDVPLECRRELAAKVFTHVADYDAAVASFLTAASDRMPPRVNLSIERILPLRYGENPHQQAALYASEEPRGISDLRQLQGKQLSFNNLLDLDAAMTAVSAWRTRPACAIIKHATPCGIAVGRTALEALARARATDPVSAFGSVIAFNTVVDRAIAEALQDLFVEVLVAPSVHEDALRVFAARQALRVLELPVSTGTGGFDWKRVRGGFLIQEQFVFDPGEDGWSVATLRQPTATEWEDLRFAWAAVATVRSNAILLARNEMAIGIGGGQTSRVDAVFLAIHKATLHGHDTRRAVMASDAFFPFADGLDAAAAAGVTAVIQPGGSIRDREVINAAEHHGMAMVMTGRRMFRH